MNKSYAAIAGGLIVTASLCLPVYAETPATGSTTGTAAGQGRTDTSGYTNRMPGTTGVYGQTTTVTPGSSTGKTPTDTTGTTPGIGNTGTGTNTDGTRGLNMPGTSLTGTLGAGTDGSGTIRTYSTPERTWGWLGFAGLLGLIGLAGRRGERGRS